jgi:TM2 domain-containing membrane protein YozV
MADVFQLLPEVQGDELVYLEGLLKGADDDISRKFAMVYRTRRRDPVNVLLLALLGFIGIAGIQRFYLEQLGMGLLYIFTAGICLIGTIVDIVSYKRLAFEYNQKRAQEAFFMIKGSRV